MAFQDRCVFAHRTLGLQKKLKGRGMDDINTVLAGYRAARGELVKVPLTNEHPVIAAVREDLPARFAEALADSGRDPEKYKIRASVGEAPLNMAAIPWVAIFRQEVTRGARHGYYIVLLFAEDGQSAVLSLNQGFHDFETEFRPTRLALLKVRQSADFAASLIQAPKSFSPGPISLSARGALGWGYERGAICSKVYRHGNDVSDADFAKDVAALLDAYDALFNIAGDSIFSILPSPNEAEFQSAVQATLNQSGNDAESLPVGPAPLPPKSVRQGRTSFQRNPKRSAEALHRAQYRCEGAIPERPHSTFTSRISKREYVEAHHLIPFGKQAEFQYSLDIPENIVALCPSCHRLLHHGRNEDRNPLLRRLLNARSDMLVHRGITIEISALAGLYQSLSDQD